MCHDNAESDDLGKVLNCILQQERQNAGDRRRYVAKSLSRRSGCSDRGGKLPEQAVNHACAFIAYIHQFFQLGGCKKTLLHKIENGLKLMKRATRDIDKSPKLFRAFARDSLREIQWNAIGCSTPLIRKIMLGCRQPVDEWTRQRGNAKRVLIGFEVPK